VGVAVSALHSSTIESAGEQDCEATPRAPGEVSSRAQGGSIRPIAALRRVNVSQEERMLPTTIEPLNTGTVGSQQCSDMGGCVLPQT
jgi:hypothetical protein